jgi:MazG family protein
MDHNRLSKAIIALVDLATRLRGPGGCPWDAQQTASTVRIYLLEEAYEVIEAIEESVPEDVCQELGDLLFQIVFLALLAQEKGAFDLVDVVEGVTEKMIRRHPHVFGDTRVDNAREVTANWTRIKIAEKKSTEASFLKSVPTDLPALLRAHRLSERAAKINFDWKSKDDIWGKVEEEFKELEEVVHEQDDNRVSEELGDLLFSLVNLSRHWGQNAEHILRLANQKFLRRFEKMEGVLKDSGLRLEEAAAEQMDQAWEKVKTAETVQK